MNRNMLFICVLLFVISTSKTFAQFIEYQKFPDGLSIVYKADRIDTLRTGPKLGFGSKYNHVTSFQGKVLAYVNYRCGVIDVAGNVIMPEYNQFIKRNGDFFEVRKGSKWGVVDLNGKEIIPCTYDILEYRDDLYRVRKNNKWGVVDASGKELIPCEYDFIVDDRDLYRVRKDKKWGVIDSVGKMIIPLEYDHLGNFENGVSRAMKNGYLGFIDKDNRVILDIKYVYINSFVDGVAETCECEDFIQANNQAMVKRYEKKGYTLLKTSTRLMAMCKNPVYSQLKIENLK